MRDILDGLDGVICHMDDSLIYSSEPEHNRRVIDVLQRLKDAGMTLNYRKCMFGRPSVKFLGYQIGVDGIRADPDRVRDIEELPDPANKKNFSRS